MVRSHPCHANSQWRERRDIRLHALSPAARRGRVEIGGHWLPCAIGKGGVRALKREGDGATPRGIWPLREVLYRRDRQLPPATRLGLRVIHHRAGWCDAPDDRNYNRGVELPYPASCECLHRSDGLYDVVVVVGYNDMPRRRHRGSAIFIHLARPGYAPTEGCVALCRRDLGLLLRAVTRHSRLHVMS